MKYHNTKTIYCTKCVLFCGALSLCLFWGARAQDKDDYSNLAQAIVDGNIRLSLQLISNLSKIDVTNSYGWTPLFHAVKHNRYELVDYILKKQANPNLISSAGITPLAVSAANNNFEITKLLLKNGAKANSPDASGSSPLSAAVSHCADIKLIKTLIDHGADINTKNKFGQTPLMEVCRQQPETARLLIDQGGWVNEQDHNGRTALFNASLYRGYEIVEILLKNGAYAHIGDKGGNNPWKIALKREDKTLQRILSQYQ